MSVKHIGRIDEKRTESYAKMKFTYCCNILD